MEICLPTDGSHDAPRVARAAQKAVALSDVRQRGLELCVGGKGQVDRQTRVMQLWGAGGGGAGVSGPEVRGQGYMAVTLCLVYVPGLRRTTIARAALATEEQKSSNVLTHSRTTACPKKNLSNETIGKSIHWFKSHLNQCN